MLERLIQNDILREFATKSPIRLWRNNSGKANYAGQVVTFGVPGQGDLSGIVFPTGRRLEVEVKSTIGRQSEQQKNFQRMIETMGGIYILARSVEDVRAGLRRNGVDV